MHGYHPYKEMREDNVLGVEAMEDLSMAGLVEQGHAMLNKHRLSDAEEFFHKTLERNTEPLEPRYKYYVMALLGLGEVYWKRGRSVRQIDLEWQRMYLLALSAHHKAVECCQKASLELHDNKAVTWFNEQKHKAVSQHHALEDHLVQTMHEKVLQQERINKYFGPKNQSSEDSSDIKDQRSDKESKYLNLDWLKKIEKHYKEKCATQRFLRSESKEEIIMDEEPPIIPMPPKPKRVNFEKVQIAIQKLVKHINEMGTYKIHPKMTPEEKLLLVSPYTSRYDLFKDFTRALGVDDSDSHSSYRGSESGDSSPQLMLDADDGATEECQTLTSEKDKRKVIEHPAPGVERFPISWYTAEASSYTPSNLSHSHSAPYLSTERSLSDSSDIELKNGVLTIWRRYESELPKPKPFVAYKLHAYEEFSPITEVVATALLCSNENEDKENCEENKLPEQSPVSEASVSLSMALTLCSMADKLRDSNRLQEAIEVYKHSLGILHSHSGPKRAFLTHMASILQRLGVVKVAMGDFAGGSQLLEECIILLENSDDREKYLKIAQVWLELGKACMADEFKAATLNEKIMLTVKDTLQSLEVKHEPSEISDDVSEDDDDSECGDSYSVCIQEATTFFQNALSILRNCRSRASGYSKLLVDVLIHLGDCLIMNGNFDSAILYYEEALKMFKSYVGAASIESNAHVMSMLATANFLLCNYPKAISLYECANVMYQHLYGEKELVNFDMAFALTMIGISYHCMTHYHRCIQWCLKAFEAYTVLFKDKTHSLKVLDRWFITETLYTLGFSYSTLNFHDNSMFYLDLAHKMLEGIADVDIKQDVKILKVMADEFATLENNEKALEYYNEALNKSMILGDEQSATALQNQLLNRMAGIHINTKDYSTAAEYLKQALDYQKNVQHTIQFDMIDMLRKLGVTYTLSGDIDKAIDCYTECVEELSDKSGLYKSDLVQILGNLGTLYHVKACIQDSNEEMIELLLSAEQHYQEALDIDPASTVCVQYANYLYQQAQAGDALLTMLPYVHIHSNKDDSILTYHGVEQAVLPEHIQQDVDDVDELSIDTPVFAKFLALLCYKQLHLTKDADDCLLSLVHTVDNSAVSLNHSMLAYALMEMELFGEAALSFRDAALRKRHNELETNNCWLAIATEVYHRCARVFRHIYEVTHKDQILEDMLAAVVSDNTVEVSAQKTNDEEMYAEEYVESSDILEEIDMKESIRDSGYYDTGMDKLYPEMYDEDRSSRHKAMSPDDIELPEHFKVMSASTVAILKQIAASKDSLCGSRLSLSASGQSNGSKPSLFSSKQSLHGSRQSLTTSHQSLNRSDVFEEENMDSTTNIHMDKGYFSSEYLESQGLDDHDNTARSGDCEDPVTFSLSGVPEDDENMFSDEFIHMEEETVETPIELLELLKQQQEEAIAREADIFGDILNSKKDMTPQNEEPDYINEPVSYHEPSYGQWRGLSYNSRNNSLNQISDGINNEKRKSSSASEEWVTTEEEVETPLAILGILERLRESNSDLGKSTSSPNIYSSGKSMDQLMPNSKSDEWHTEVDSAKAPTVIRSVSHPAGCPSLPESHSEEIPMETSPVRETPPSSHPWQNRSHSQSGSVKNQPGISAQRPTAISNNNNESLRHTDWRQNGSRTSQATYGTQLSSMDERNGNQKKIPDDEEVREDMWEEWVTVETVETPPEILAVLAQQRVQ